MVYSTDLEKLVIGGLLKFPDSYAEVASFLTEEDFQHDINRVAYSIMSHCLARGEAIDKYLVAQKIRNLNISNRDDIEPYDYLDGLSMLQTTPKVLIQSVQDLKVFTRRRQFIEVADRIKNKMMNAKNMSYADINSWVDKSFYECMNSYFDSNDAIDLFEDMYSRAEKLALDPQEEMGLKTPYKHFNEMYGGFQPGEAYVFCARPKNGKSSMLNSMSMDMSYNIHNIPCLILDTEMQSDMISDRILASLTGIPLWHLRTGNWIKHEEYREKFEKHKAKQKNKPHNIYHKYVANMPLERIITTIKKWYYTKVGRGNPCIIVYDYIKITGEKINDSNKEYQAIGEKLSRLKELVGTEVNAPLLTACQLNRSADVRSGGGSKGKHRHADDATAIATSDRILWFASGVWIFRRKSLEEIVEYGDEFGSHSLIHIESRWLGRNATGHNDLVKTHENDLINNFINFDLENFKVREIGSAEQMFDKLRVQMNKPKKVEDPL